MKTWTYRVSGQEVVINRVEQPEDLDGFRDFVRKNLRGLGCDSETTGLDIYSKTFGLRLVQFGNSTEAWVLPVERGGVFAEDARRALRGLESLVFQNAPFDLQVFDRCLGVDMESLWPKVVDTKILAHLVDPRGKEEGGIGQALEGLTKYYIDPAVAENVKALPAKWAKEMKTTKAKMWAEIDLDHDEYNLYAGMDPILAWRLREILYPRVPIISASLIRFEHKVAEVCSYMERSGFLLDEEYARDLSAQLSRDEEKYSGLALAYGVDSVNSTEMVADALERMKVKIPGRTPTGKRKVDKTLLDPLVKAGNPLAIAVVEAKKARKWRTTWVDGFLAGMDSDGRCHAAINSLRARTARMSITGIPAQTLPANDALIRSCFIADPGHSIVSIDYKGQELRVLAALSGDQTMINAFLTDQNLHLITARAAFGNHVEKDTKEYKGAKVGNFAKVYGGGAKAIHEQTGMSLDAAKEVVKAFDKTYPGVKRYSDRLQQMATNRGAITTPMGRVLPVDKDRPYAALNYMVQSTSRDVTCKGLVRLHEAGYTPYLRLPIHDEVLASLPEAKAEWGANRIASIMAEQMGPVFIDTDADVYGRSWGDGYKH